MSSMLLGQSPRPASNHDASVVNIPGQIERSMRYRRSTDVTEWQQALRARLIELLVIPEGAYPLAPRRSLVRRNETHTLYRISYRVEEGIEVPGYLMIPHDVEPPYPVMICVQGHAPDGIRVSIGEVPARRDRPSDFGVQAVNHGWAALAIEMRSFNERRSDQFDCHTDSLHGVLAGKPMTGRRVYDVMRAIDFIQTQRDLDASIIGIMGNSMGGTVSLFAAAADERIGISVVSCSYCTYERSWLRHRHCPCGYIPNIGRYADMGDVGGLIAPRKLLIVAGANDSIADLEGVREAFEQQTMPVYQAAGVPDQATLVVGDGGHQFYPEIAWPVITRHLESRLRQREQEQAEQR